MLLTLAVSSTIGFWAIFSKIDGGQSSAGAAQTADTNNAPLVEESQVVVNLPPIPTLIPTLDSSMAAPVAQNGLPSPVMIDATIPTPSLIKLPNNDNRSSRGNNDAVKQKKKQKQATSTQSSR